MCRRKRLGVSRFPGKNGALRRVCALHISFYARAFSLPPTDEKNLSANVRDEGGSGV